MKRLQTYEKRLSDRVAELETAQAASEAARAEAERLVGLARTDRQNEEARAANIRVKTVAVADAVSALNEEVSARTIRRNEAGRITARMPERIRPAMPEIRPVVAAAADLVAGMDAACVDLAADQKKLKSDQRDLINGQMKLMEDAVEIETLRLKLKRALGLVAKWLKRPDLTDDAKRDGQNIVAEAAHLQHDEDDTDHFGPGMR